MPSRPRPSRTPSRPRARSMPSLSTSRRPWRTLRPLVPSKTSPWYVSVRTVDVVGSVAYYVFILLLGRGCLCPARDRREDRLPRFQGQVDAARLQGTFDSIYSVFSVSSMLMLSYRSASAICPPFKRWDHFPPIPLVIPRVITPQDVFFQCQAYGVFARVRLETSHRRCDGADGMCIETNSNPDGFCVSFVTDLSFALECLIRR